MGYNFVEENIDCDPTKQKFLELADNGAAECYDIPEELQNDDEILSLLAKFEKTEDFDTTCSDTERQIMLDFVDLRNVNYFDLPKKFRQDKTMLRELAYRKKIEYDWLSKEFKSDPGIIFWLAKYGKVTLKQLQADKINIEDQYILNMLEKNDGSGRTQEEGNKKSNSNSLFIDNVCW